MLNKAPSSFLTLILLYDHGVQSPTQIHQERWTHPPLRFLFSTIIFPFTRNVFSRSPPHCWPENNFTFSPSTTFSCFLLFSTLPPLSHTTVKAFTHTTPFQSFFLSPFLSFNYWGFFSAAQRWVLTSIDPSFIFPFLGGCISNCQFLGNVTLFCFLGFNSE